MKRPIRPMLRALALAALTLTVTGAGAQVYKHVDGQGNVTYSDEPGPGSEKVKLPEIQYYTPPPRPPAPAAEAAAAPPADVPEPVPAYSVRVVSPAHDSTVINNEGTVQLGAIVKPELRASERLTLYLDGQAVGAPSAATVHTAEGVDRGAHTVRATVVDGDGKVLAESATITFFLRRHFRKPAN